MTATNAFETAVLELYFVNTAHANVGDAGGLQPSGVAGSFYVSLHTADPGEAGDQTTSEASYTGYARIAVARSAAGWTVAGDNVSNAAEIAFDPCTLGSDTVTHFGLGSDLSGVGNLFFTGSLGTPKSITAGKTPSFPIGTLNTSAE